MFHIEWSENANKIKQVHGFETIGKAKQAARRQMRRMDFTAAVVFVLDESEGWAEHFCPFANHWHRDD